MFRETESIKSLEKHMAMLGWVENQIGIWVHPDRVADQIFIDTNALTPTSYREGGLWNHGHTLDELLADGYERFSSM